MGGAVARAFAREGASVSLAGRTLATLDAVAEEITAAGGVAETAHVDALDEKAVDEHADAVAEKAGSIDVSFNAITNVDVQGVRLAVMPFDDFARPITKAMRNQFLTARAVSRHMAERGSGVILTITGGYRGAFPEIGARWSPGRPPACPRPSPTRATRHRLRGGHDARGDHRGYAGADRIEEAGVAGGARQGSGVQQPAGVRLPGSQGVVPGIVAAGQALRLGGSRHNRGSRQQGRGAVRRAERGALVLGPPAESDLAKWEVA